MGLLKQSLLAITLIAGASFTCAAQSADQTAIRERIKTTSQVMNDARKLVQANPREAMAMLEQAIEAESPALDFNSEDLNTVMASYDYCLNMAYLYRETAMAADFSGQWEKAAEYYKKSREALVEPAEKSKAAFVRFSENIENNIKQLRELIDSDEFKELKAREESDYTNDDYTVLERLQFFESELTINQEALDYFKSRSEKADKDVASFNPEQPLDELMFQKIKVEQDEIKHRQYGGNTAKWVDSVVTHHAAYMKDYPSQEEKIALVYRLIVLSPDNKKAPVLLDFLKGNATEAELNKAISPPRAAAKKKTN
ncbi:MAG: hypothetical protein LBQ86_08455 [Holophagales bacterium]|nr:hypothetical protein [Holophagales bacterium]